MRALLDRIRPIGLGLFFGGIFAVTLIAQSLAGWNAFNDEQTAAHLFPISYLDYVTSASFAADVTENWQSEYLQFLLFIGATVWLVHRGSPESKDLDEVGRGTDEQQMLGRHVRKDSPSWAKATGWRRSLYSHSLLWTMGAIFVASWAVQWIAGHAAYNEQQLIDYQDPLTLAEYLGSADFWNRTFQNWQSEFLAVGSMVVLSVYLRERGSPESKPVGAPHAETNVEG
ncbi:DUF6766 family protein [Naasia sp. SYSU D00057]|uniref:DUF6766 family protein n=1 Tax=Naasia sp. SYSU D00057 TaxID=2817380 RepID=UPI001B3061BB|nr:DUF6766 family protein [Naasia sp. SYSU D00057]